MGDRKSGQRTETSGWLRQAEEQLRAGYRRCSCGQRFPTADRLRLHLVRECVGDTGVEMRRLGEQMGYRTAIAPTGFGVERMLELVRP